MTTRRSKNLFIVFAIVLTILLLASFVNITLPIRINGKYYSYTSFAYNLSLGQDVGNSVRIVYRTDYHKTDDANKLNGKSNYATLKQSTINQLLDIVKDAGYVDVVGYTYNDDSIAIEVGNLITVDDENNIINLIGAPTSISFSLSSDGKNPFAGANDVKSVDVVENAEAGVTVYGIQITFEDYVYDKIKDSENTTLYAFLGDSTIINSLNFDLQTFKETNSIGFYNDSIRNNKINATAYANTIRTGILDLELTPLQCEPITASYGAHAHVFITILSAIVVLGMFVFLIVKYKQLGWLACFNLLFFITIGLFVLQSIPIVNINYAGIIGMLLCFVVAADVLMEMFENAKKHYQADTKFYICLNIAKKESLIRTLILNTLLCVTGFICVFMPTMAVKSFGWAMLVLPLVNMFTSQVLMRLFINMYLPFNSINGAKCNFNKGGKDA